MICKYVWILELAGSARSRKGKERYETKLLNLDGVLQKTRRLAPVVSGTSLKLSFRVRLAHLS